MTEDQAISEQDEPIELKDPVLAAFLAWLIPGLGHYYQKRTGKAVLYFVCVMSIFLYGVYLSGNSTLGWGRGVYASWRPGDRRFYYFGQFGAGLVALPALVQAKRVRDGKSPLCGGLMAPPQMEGSLDNHPTLNTIHKQLPRYFDLGSVYALIAGMLNILAIYDAWGGPVFVLPTETEEKKRKKKQGAKATESDSVEEDLKGSNAADSASPRHKGGRQR